MNETQHLSARSWNLEEEHRPVVYKHQQPSKSSTQGTMKVQRSRSLPLASEEF